MFDYGYGASILHDKLVKEIYEAKNLLSQSGYGVEVVRRQLWHGSGRGKKPGRWEKRHIIVDRAGGEIGEIIEDEGE